MANILWVRHGGTWLRAPQQELRVWVRHGGTRRAEVVWKHIQGGWISFLPTVRLAISAGISYNFNLRSWLIANTPWDETTPIAADITNYFGSSVGSQSVNVPAFDVSGLPQGSEVFLRNEGNIYGAGGNGGAPQANSSANGRAGGIALFARHNIRIQNLGRIWGGGGGGGSAWSETFEGPNEPLSNAASESGGGAGLIGGNGGYAVNDVGQIVAGPGGGGSTTAPGAGGPFDSEGQSTAQGGDGGDNGLSGISGTGNGDGSSIYGSGGAAGAAIDGDSRVSFEFGDTSDQIRGPRVN